MNVVKTLLSGIVATSAMTLYSYAVSRSKKENFREPELLAELADDFLPAAVRDLAIPAGWIAHYSVGLGLALGLEAYWQKNRTKRSVMNGMLAGAVAGLGGIMVWELTFRLHPRQPVIPYSRFYGQLLVAHIVYSVTLSKMQKRLEA